jgi:prolyl oligopeptidase
MSELLIPPANYRSKSAAAAEDGTDPYRWLEDSASPETAAWVTAQNERTQAYLASVPAREVIRSRLLTTGDHDDRVMPGHSFRFAAALQEAQRGDAPVCLRMDASSGHGRGKPAAKALAEAADRLAFIEGALGMSPFPCAGPAVNAGP